MVRNHEGSFFVFCSVYNRDSNETMNHHLVEHGDGVRDIALTVDDATAVFEYSVKNGAIPVHAPYKLEDKDGHVILATIKTYGDTTHTFI